MGTAGPLALARDILYEGDNHPFFVLNRWLPAQVVALVYLCILSR